ncbi:MAG: hypothetical protein K940chlam7_01478 [Chlamydiae bacterium]|nr:hypothetical protein [Chlamydiota bacterium]
MTRNSTQRRKDAKNTKKISLFSLRLCAFALNFLALCSLSPPLYSVTVDLREPTFSEGVLTTEKGGVISAPNLRVQARKICYTRKEVEGQQIVYLEAEKDIILEFGEYIFVGKRLEYDFQEKRGILYDGRTAAEPWFLGGEEIHLCPDGSYTIHHGFATTSENYKTDWQIETEEAKLTDGRLFSARNVKFRYFSLPLFWMPSFCMNLDTIFDSPFRYTVRTGGTQGPRVGLTYEVFSWKRLKSLLLLDYRIKKGLGGGFELHYKSPNRKELFHSINYIAQDTTRFDQKKRTRYRLQGTYSNLLDCDRSSILLTYDKLSDKDMATDYNDKDLRLDTARRTQLDLRRQENDWILTFLARIRVNSFQTVKQQLPTLSGSLRPFEIGRTGIISDNRCKLSYLELEHTDKQADDDDFNSPRYELSNKLYRPFQWGHINFTPEVGTVAIYYGNNSDKFDRWMTIGLFEFEANTNLHRLYGNCKNVISPYLRYKYFTHPSTSPDGHFIFDIDDGWYFINSLRFGLNNNLYTKTSNGCIYRKIYTDIYAFAFIDSDKIPNTVPKVYAKVVYNFTPFLRSTTLSAWDTKRNMLDHINTRLEWSINPDIAISAEYRHRSPYDWRKVDHTNFILDSFRNVDKLRESTLSDQRDTLLLNFFYRFHLNWALGLQSRSGWNRFEEEPNYNEYQVDLFGSFRSAWHLRLSYRHREDDDRFIINLSVGLKRPDSSYGKCLVPCIEF